MRRFRIWRARLQGRARRQAPARWSVPPPRLPPADQTLRQIARDWLRITLYLLAYVVAAVAIGVAIALLTGSASAASCKPPALPAPVSVVKLQAGSVRQLAGVAWGEARGEPEPFCSMVAVSWVIINRIIRDPATYGATVEQVITKPFQFSVFGRRDPNRAKIAQAAESDPHFLLALLAASAALTGAASDPTGGATHFYAAGLGAPAWALRMERRARIGAHVFLRER